MTKPLPEPLGAGNQRFALRPLVVCPFGQTLCVYTGTKQREFVFQAHSPEELWQFFIDERDQALALRAERNARPPSQPIPELKIEIKL